MSNSEQVQLFRTRYVWWVIATFWSIIFLLMAGVAVVPQAPLLGRAVCGIIAAAIAFVILRARRAGIETSPTHVLVRQYSGRCTQVQWSAIESFGLSSASPYNRGVLITVRLKNGRLLKTQGLVAPSRRSKSAARLLAELESRRPS